MMNWFKYEKACSKLQSVDGKHHLTDLNQIATSTLFGNFHELISNYN